MRSGIKRFVAKVLLMITMCAALLLQPGCTAPANVPEDYRPKSSWAITEGITVSLRQDHYPKNAHAITLVFENRTGRTMLYGRGWRFEKLVRGKWQPVEAQKISPLPTRAIRFWSTARRACA